MQDSHWKISHIIPLVDKLINHLERYEINLLDVGGGAGLTLRETSDYIQKIHAKRTNKFALDLSPGMLEIQKERNPDLKKALCEDICSTSLSDKEIDLVLLIDVLEHVFNPKAALEEINRISRFAILKVPLEDNIVLFAWNFLRRGKPRQIAAETIGHVNVYNLKRLRRQIKEHLGQILAFGFTNVFGYRLRSGYYRRQMTIPTKIMSLVAEFVFRISPLACSIVFPDFIMILVRCYEKQKLPRQTKAQ